MLLDTASAKHGHEYSPPRPAPSSPPPSNSSFFNNSPLSVLTSVLKRSTNTPSPVNAPPIDPPEAVHAPDASNTPKHSMFTEPETLPVTSPGVSRPSSSGSVASTQGRHKKRNSRSKTTFNLAQPPPKSSSRQKKLHLRPKVLLQLQQVIPSHRPKPAYEVIPSTLLNPRQAKKYARTFNCKDKLGINDILIVKAEDYALKDEEDRSDEERWGSRDVIGVISVGRKDEKDNCIKTLILPSDGTSWEVSLMTNGGYEFVYTDDHGLQLKCRWVPKTAHSRRMSSMSNGSLNFPNVMTEDRAFKFSTISANSRRHPVIATMTKTSIEILDSYSMPSATSPGSTASLYFPNSPIQTPIQTPSKDMNSFMDLTNQTNESQSIKTDDALRKFIVITGIWVAFSEGWSATYNYSKAAYPTPISTSATPKIGPPNRTVSMSVLDSSLSASPSPGDENRRSFPRILRSSTNLRNSSLSNNSSPSTSNFSSSPLNTRPRRSNSTGNAELNANTGSLRRKYGLGLEEPTVPETDEERQSKRSVELLRMKELTLPSPHDSQRNSVQSVHILEPSRDTSRTSSPGGSNLRDSRKAHSAYNPVDTAGLWDSGVSGGPGLKSRPTSLVVDAEKKAKAKKKKQKTTSKGLFGIKTTTKEKLEKAEIKTLKLERKLAEEQERKRVKQEKKEKVEKEDRKRNDFKDRFVSMFRKEKA